MSTKIRLARSAICTAASKHPVSRCPRRVASSLVSVLLWGALAAQVRGQGCVQSRGAGGPCMLMHDEEVFPKAGQWQVSVGYRWLHSDREFSGIDEITGLQVGGGQENKSR